MNMIQMSGKHVYTYKITNFNIQHIFAQVKHTLAFLVTVVPFEDSVVFETFLAVDVGGGCAVPAFILVDARTYYTKIQPMRFKYSIRYLILKSIYINSLMINSRNYFYPTIRAPLAV